MKVAVIGTRCETGLASVWHDLDRARARWGDFTVVSGGARGVDTFAALWAADRGLTMVEFLPDYFAHGRRAPLVRNQTIVDNADRVIAFWDGKSGGTAYTIRLAKEAGKPVYIRPLG